MINLFRCVFPKHYGIDHPVDVPIIAYEGDFSLGDSIACGRCFSEQKLDCNQKNLKVSATCRVNVIEYESYINSMPHRKALHDQNGKRCDVVMYDDGNGKIVFADMTCSEPKYVEPYWHQEQKKPGKRAEVYEKLKQSIAKVKAVDADFRVLDSFAKRIALFACREKNNQQPMDAAARRMKRFSRMDEMHKAGNYKTDMGNGFHFVCVCYPIAYQW